MSATSTAINVFTFLITTILYYVFAKPSYSVANMADKKSIQDVLKNQKWMQLLYFLLILVGQFIINIMAISARCGNSSAQNIGAAFTITFLPWLLIFGVMMVLIMVLPGMKSGFSDVLGYLAVSWSANKLVTDLLIDPDIENQINSDKLDENEKSSLRHSAQSIVRIMGNMSVLINQVVPANFAAFWTTLYPLMKPEYKNNPDGGETMRLKQQFLRLATIRDNVGEGCWYVYTGVFIIFLTSYYVGTYRCSVDPNIMNKNYDEYVKKKKKEEEKKAKENNVVYKMD